MRVQAGLLKGRAIPSPKGGNTRPTHAKIRAAVFNVLQTEIELVRFLDLFSGSAAMGIEAFSRGATHVSLVDHDKAAVALQRQFISSLNQTDLAGRSVDSIYMPVEKFLAHPAFPQKFDIIWADPPYADGAYWFELITKSLENVLKPAGLFIFESEKNLTIPDGHSSIKLWKKKTYGGTAISYYEFLGS